MILVRRLSTLKKKYYKVYDTMINILTINIQVSKN